MTAVHDDGAVKRRPTYSVYTRMNHVPAGAVTLHARALA
jgi:hypothetical protein